MNNVKGAVKKITALVLVIITFVLPLGQFALGEGELIDENVVIETIEEALDSEIVEETEEEAAEEDVIDTALVPEVIDEDTAEQTKETEEVTEHAYEVTEEVTTDAEEAKDAPAEKSEEILVEANETKEEPEAAEETIEETEDEAFEEVIEEAVEETIEEAIEETVEETAVELTEEAIDEPVQENIEELTEEVSEEVSEEITEETIDESVEALEETTEAPADIELITVENGDLTAEELMNNLKLTSEYGDAPSGSRSVVSDYYDVGLKVTFPSTITCGTPVTFKCTGSNGSGNYAYAFNAVLKLNSASNTWEYESDLSWNGNGAYRDDPNFTYTFATPGTYWLKFWVLDKGVSPMQMGSANVNITIKTTPTKTVEEIEDEIVAKCLANGFKTQYEMAVYFHDYILSIAQYDWTYANASKTGVLMKGSGTCESYHRALSALLAKVGVKTERAENNDHVWTRACLDGKWVMIDATWDDGYQDGSYMSHLFFGITDEMADDTHDGYEHASQNACNSMESHYYMASGLINNWSNPIKAAAEKLVAAGDTSFVVKAVSDMYSTVNLIANPLVAYKLSKEGISGKEVKVTYDKSNLSFKFIVSAIACVMASATPSAAVQAAVEKASAVATTTGNKDASKTTTTTTTGTNSTAATAKPTTATATAKPATVTVSNQTATTVKTVKVKGVSLTKTSAKLSIGSVLSLSVKFNPTNTTQKSISWKSSNAKIAAVDKNGKVTALKTGKATITATAANGSKATCQITVNKATLKLNKKSAKVDIGKTLTLKTTTNVVGLKASFKSSNNKVATVDGNGNIKGVSAGKATITATIGGVKATCKITVNKPTVKLNKKSAKVDIGAVTKLTATVNANGLKVTYKSSNNKVATVDGNGNVKALKAGKATITVSAGGAKATCKITVKKPTIKLSAKTLKVKIGQAKKLTATVSAKGLNVSFKSGNTKVATVDSLGNIVALKAGKATITVSAGGVKTVCKVTVNK